ncbi:MAG: hypothetical protein ACRD1T_06080, partial [Acidimicrobiia bacterium]
HDGREHRALDGEIREDHGLSLHRRDGGDGRAVTELGLFFAHEHVYFVGAGVGYALRTFSPARYHKASE